MQDQNEEQNVQKVGFISRMFGSLTPSFLIRNYVFGIAITYVIWAYMIPPEAYTVHILLVINCIFFPFATLIWDEIRDTMMGGTAIILNLWLMLAIKAFIKIMIYMFAIPVGLLGMLYIWFRTR